MPSLKLPVPPPIAIAISGLIDREGGYSDHPADKGGSTKYGITQDSLATWRGDAVTKDDVKNLTIKEAHEYYFSKVYLQFGIFTISVVSNKIATIVFDWAVHSGEYGVIKFQKMLGVIADGMIGPMTRAALEHEIVKFGEDKYCEMIIDYRIRHYIRICKAAANKAQMKVNNGVIINVMDETQLVFLEGWFNRLSHLRNHIHSVPSL